MATNQGVGGSNPSGRASNTKGLASASPFSSIDKNMNILAGRFPSIGGAAEELRKTQRFPLRLQAAVIYHRHLDIETRPTFHGRTCDVSICGASVVIDRNVFHDDDVTVLLGVPAEQPGEGKRIIEVTAKMIYTVFSPAHDAFRIGMHFQEFKNKGKTLLQEILEQRAFYVQD